MDREARTDASGTTLTEAARSDLPFSLAGNHRLELERGSDEDRLLVRAADGSLRVTVVVTPEGTRIELAGGELAIRSSGGVAIDADRVSLSGRRGLSLATDEDLEIRAGGVIRTEGHAQHLVSRRGDLTVYANDDVRISAERIKMNC